MGATGRRWRRSPSVRTSNRTRLALAFGPQVCCSDCDLADRVFVVLKGPRRGQPLSAKEMDENLAAARRRAGLEHATCHELRHTCLTRLREAGMALEAVQAQTGHASIESTRIYLHLGRPVSGHDELHRPPSVSSDHLVPFTDQLRLAVAAYLVRFTGASRDHTESDLRCYLAWCAERGENSSKAKCTVRDLSPPERSPKPSVPHS
jgi:Phage integrase family